MARKVQGVTWRPRVPWVQKLRPDLKPRVVSNPWGPGTMLVPTPLLIAAELRKVRRGRLTTVADLRARLARNAGATATCPMTTGILLHIVAGATEERLEAGGRPTAPYWRVVGPQGELNPKWPPGPARQARHLRSEGHRVVRRAGEWRVEWGCGSRRMALVVFLRGVNVGGHRTFRPSKLAQQLAHLDAVNVGAAGTFVIRRPVDRAQLRREFARRLPFDAEIMICRGREIIGLAARDTFWHRPARPDVVPFVSVLSKRPRSMPAMPMSLPSTGRWLLRILAREGRFVLGVYRRHMKVIGYLGKLDTLFGTPVTTRGWKTMVAIAKVLTDDATGRPGERRREPRRSS